MVWDVVGISEVKRPEKCFNTLNSSHRMCNSKGNNGEAGFLIKRKLKDYIVRVSSIIPRISEHVLCIEKRLQIKDSASTCTNNIILRRRYK